MDPADTEFCNRLTDKERGDVRSYFSQVEKRYWSCKLCFKGFKGDGYNLKRHLFRWHKAIAIKYGIGHDIYQKFQSKRLKIEES